MSTKSTDKLRKKLLAKNEKKYFCVSEKKVIENVLTLLTLLTDYVNKAENKGQCRWREMVVSGDEARGGRTGLPFLPPLEKSARVFGLQLRGSVLKYGY